MSKVTQFKSRNTRKAELKRELLKINSQFEIIDTDLLDDKSSGIDEYVACLDNPDLDKHLLETELVPIAEELDEFRAGYQGYDNLIDTFHEMMFSLESLGMVASKGQELSND